MLTVTLFEPQIPPNTGNIARLCGANNVKLDLVGSLGFNIDDKYLKRAGLDYWPYMNIKIHTNYEIFFNSLSKVNRIIGFSKSSKNYQNDFVLTTK